VLSLWKVDDRATSLLMRRFYENLLGKRVDLNKPLPKAEALAEAKAWLRGLDVARVARALDDIGLTRGGLQRVKADPASSTRPYEHPYYWAALILVGNPD
jgi:CHAT domain-containing protein